MKNNELNIKECPDSLFSFAYRVLNSIEDAKDISQDVLVDYLSSKNVSIKDPRNYLIKSTINKSINYKKRKNKVNPFVDFYEEPIVPKPADINIDIEDKAMISFQILSNSLNTIERVVFILKEAFDYSHDEIAEFLSISSQNSRKILSRSKTKLRSIKFVTPQKMDKATINCLKSFIEAIKNQNISQLKKLLEIA
jgi:RNA polymerase sigma-70 factor (ECF subfamily)